MKTLISALLLLPLLLASGCGGPDPVVQTGQRVSDLTLAGPDGKPLNLPAATHGQVLLIHFWADWCPLCIDELRRSKALAERYRLPGLRIVAINLEQTPDQVAKLLTRLELNYPVLYDRKGMAARRFGVTGLPASFLIDREGRLQRRIVGAIPSHQLEQLVQTLF